MKKQNSVMLFSSTGVMFKEVSNEIIKIEGSLYKEVTILVNCE